MSKIAPQTQVNANTQLVLNESTTTDAPVRALFQQVPYLQHVYVLDCFYVLTHGVCLRKLVA